MGVTKAELEGKSRSVLAGKLLGYIESEILAGEEVALDCDTPLLKLGIIDSIELVNLVAFIEDELGIEVDNANLRPENFESIEAIAQFLETRDPASPTAVAAASPTAVSPTAAAKTAMVSEWFRVAEDAELHLLRRPARDRTGALWLCIPALGTAATSWSLLARVADPDQEVLAVDLAGFGVSRSTRSEVSFRDHVEMISTFLTLHVEGRVCLLGCSAGGLIAAEVALRHRERVQALVLLGVGRPESPKAWRDFLLARTRTPEELMSALFFRSPPSSLFAEAVEKILQSPAYKDFMDEEALAFLDSGFARLEVPTLFIQGREDSMMSTADAMAAASQVAGASLELIADCGHLPHVEQAEAVSSLLKGFFAPAELAQYATR